MSILKYSNIYEKIIQRGLDRNWKSDRWRIGKTPPPCYVEVHHIIPKCLGGSNNNDNLVVLTQKEHRIAHLVLSKVITGNPKIQLNANKMGRNNNRSQTMKKFWQDNNYRYHTTEAIKQYSRNPKVKEQFRKRMLGKNLGGKNPRAKKVLNVKTNEIYSCIKDAAIKLNINYSTLKYFLKNNLTNKCNCTYYTK